ncbi:FadR/GntR family transcriptional regulator [Paenibacillus cymbidii]|uniref:FadR/GntR family transcriptional regulator n=1 Tax=Paenibacillus cymbidii TaxID=1639034 RepID=UPI001081BD29|nr:FadR/GntR family transcriptional regulator [Paenibacillus cymbidii]
MELGKIKQDRISDQIAGRIKTMIAGGQFKPGDKLPAARELAETFEVGRSTIREALSALKAMGLVESRQGEGSYVRKVAPDEVNMPDLQSLLLGSDTILELLEARKALEVANAALAAEKRSEEDLAAFRGILKTMKDHLGNEEEGERADMAFHLSLAGATGNSIMARLLETISAQMELAIRETRRLQMYASRTVSEQLLREHEEIFDAICARDAALAQEKMKQHLFHVERVLIRFLK